MKIKNGERYVAIFEEKHGTNYFVVLSEKELHDVCLFMLKTRFEQGWYPEPREPKIAAPAYTKEEAEKLKGIAKEYAEQEIRTFHDAHKRYARDKEDWQEIKSAIDNNDGKSAYTILDIRSDHEYESFIVEPANLPGISVVKEEKPNNGKKVLERLKKDVEVYDEINKINGDFAAEKSKIFIHVNEAKALLETFGEG